MPALLCLAAACLAAPPDGTFDTNWPRWRGPLATGVAPHADPPLEWSETNNVRWKTPIPGRGTASPIVWGDAVYVLTAIDTGAVDPSKPRPEDQPDRVFGIKYPNTAHQFVALAFDRASGDERWRRVLAEEVPHEGVHGDTSFAAASPVTDGERLYCSFGSAGVYALTLDGEPAWGRDLGEAYVGAALGEGSSPAVHDGKLVLVRDHARQSEIVVLDAASGDTLWEKTRDEPNAWATPLVIQPNGRPQVVAAASNAVRSYDLETGEIVWTATGLTGNVIPAPVTDGNFVYCMSGYQGHSLLAIPVDGAGDVTARIAWSVDRGTPYVPSPLLDDGRLYFTQSNKAILTVLEAKTGREILGRTRLPGLSNVYASSVAAAGRIYFTGRDGATVVLDRSAEFNVLATNRLDERTDSSPAAAGDALFIRGERSLYCLAEFRPDAPARD